YADFSLPNASYRGRWFNPNFKKSSDEDQKPDRIWDRQSAEAILQKCLGKPASVSEEKKPSSQSCPPLYDLTSLQREANSRFNFTARKTLQILQALYEKHKVLTYPRTDSRFLPTDYLPSIQQILSSIHIQELVPFAKQALDSGWVKLNPRIFDNSKVTDHHAIIPTNTPPKSLDDAETKIYDLVTRRLVAIFYPPARFEITTRISIVQGESFRSEGKILLDPGWLAVYGKSLPSNDQNKDSDTSDKILPPIPQNYSPLTANIEIKTCQTKPPPRFTEASLLAAMEGAGKFVEDDELRQALSERGLGTPATRAQIIEGLVADGYVNRIGRDLHATQKGISLIALLRSMGIQALTSPELTGEWEFRLKKIEQGQFDRAQFMQQICSFTSDVVHKAKSFSGEIPSDN
ncbi:MAG: DNA topoisomerase, partial [Chthoniobacterales bacterium]|nr:DNA topoisomerase [Chthoniobacterales bacterium]